MLLIHRKQRERAGDPAFVARIVQHLRLHFFDDVCLLPIETLRHRVAHGVGRARAQGLTYERTIALFVSNMIRINPEFDKHPAMARILADTDRPEEERMQALVIEPSGRDWDEAERQCDADVYWKNVDAELED